MPLQLPAFARGFFGALLLIIALATAARSQTTQVVRTPDTVNESLEEQKLENERMKARWTAAGAIVPMVVALLTLGYSVLSLRRTVVAQFVTKAAEIALEGPGPQQAINRARLLAAMFGDMLPRDFTKRFADLKPTDYGTVGNPQIVMAKKEFLKLLADYPQQRAQIIEDWRALFPADKWVDKIAVLPRTADMDSSTSSSEVSG